MYSVKFFTTLILASFALAANSNKKQPPFYKNSEHIVELTPSFFDDFVYTSNYTSIIEFYAPWCGYCRQLEPEFKKAAKQGHNYAQFGAVNCDDEKNKQFCASQNIKGFPTILMYRPPKTFTEHKPRKQQYATQPYENERTSKKMIDTAKGNVKSYTKNLKISKLEKFLDLKEDTLPRVLLLSEKYQISPMYKILAVDFMGSMEFSHMVIRDDSYIDTINQLLPEYKDTLVFPSIIVVHQNGVSHYSGEINKRAIAKFLTEFAKPSDGEFSERHQIIKGIKDGKYKSFKHYEKMKAKKAAAKQSFEKDEL